MNLFVFQRTAVTEQGNVIPNAEITVYAAGTTTQVDLFDDAAGTAKGNPFNAGPTDGEADGFIQFYVAFGQYDIAVNGVVLWENQTIGRPELDDITSLSSLNPAALVDGQQFSVGGSIFRWDSSDSEFKLTTALYVSAFGKVGTSDDTGAIRAAHEYANSNGFPLSYAGLSTVRIQSNARIPVNTSVDFAGVTIAVVGGIYPEGDLSFGIPNIIYKVEDPETPLVEGALSFTVADLYAGSTEFADNVVPGPGYFTLEGDPTLHFESNRDEDGTRVFEQPFYLNSQGVCNYGLARDLSDGQSSLNVKYRLMPANGVIILSDFVVDSSTFNNESIISISRNNVKVSAFSTKIDDGGTWDSASINNIISTIDCCRVFIDTGDLDNVAQAGTASYALSYSRVADVFVSKVSATGEWGSFTGNFVNGIHYDKCSSNRFDIHDACYNVFHDWCHVHGVIQYGQGGGVLSATNCYQYGEKLITKRVDYGGSFRGLIEAKNVRISGGGATLTVVDLGFSGGISSGGLDTYCPSVTVDGVSDIQEVLTGRTLTGVFMRRGSEHTGTVTFAPNHVSISNVEAGSRTSFVNRIEYGTLDRDGSFSSAFSMRSVTCNPQQSLASLLSPAGAPTTPARLLINASNVTKLVVDVASDIELQAARISSCGIGDITLPSGNRSFARGTCLIDGGTVTSSATIAKATASSLAGRMVIQNIFIDTDDAVDLSDSGIKALSGIVINGTSVTLPSGVTEADALTGWSSF